HLVALLEQLATQVPSHLSRSHDDHVHRRAYPLAPAPRAAASLTSVSSISIATLVGQIVCSPCCSYHSARYGSRIRAITVGTLNRRCAIWAITMFVLSPSVEATNASARSIPASSSASISRPVPTVNCPPTSSQEFSSPISSRACASGSSSRHETVWPSRSIDR